MATKKDLNTSDNIGPNKKAHEDWENHHDRTDRFPDEAKGIAETEVKNAHAAGDGAMGPNETPLPDVDKDRGEEHHEEPPY